MLFCMSANDPRHYLPQPSRLSGSNRFYVHVNRNKDDPGSAPSASQLFDETRPLISPTDPRGMMSGLHFAASSSAEDPERQHPTPRRESSPLTSRHPDRFAGPPSELLNIGSLAPAFERGYEVEI
jgi:hypothetical protein